MSSYAGGKNANVAERTAVTSHPTDPGRGASGGATADPAGAYHHGDLPSALLAAVESLIAREGIGAVSLRAVAREVGVSHAAPAHHFGDKQGLLTAFACRGYERFSAALAAAARSAPADDPVAALHAVRRAYVTFATEQRGYYEVMFRPDLASGDEVAGGPSTDDAFEVLRTAVVAALGDAARDQRRVLMTALLLWCAVHGLVHLWFDGPLRHMQADYAPGAGAVDLTDLSEAMGTMLTGMLRHPDGGATVDGG